MGILGYNLQRFQRYQREDVNEYIRLVPKGEVNIHSSLKGELTTLQVMVGNLIKGLNTLKSSSGGLEQLASSLRAVNMSEETVIDPHTFIVQMAINRGLCSLETPEGGDLRWYYLYTQLSTMLEVAGDMIQKLAEDIGKQCFKSLDFMQALQPQYELRFEPKDEKEVNKVREVSQHLIEALEIINKRIEDALKCFDNLIEENNKIIAFEKWRKRSNIMEEFNEKLEAVTGSVIGVRFLSLIGAILWVVESIITVILQFSTAPKIGRTSFLAS